jgi:hypothetical protein
MSKNHLDNFDSFYKAAKSGWAKRTVSHYKSDWNPEGIVCWLWRQPDGYDLSVSPSQLSLHVDRPMKWKKWPELIYQASIDGDEKNLGYYSTLEEAQKAAEDEADRRRNKAQATKQKRFHLTVQGIAEKVVEHLAREVDDDLTETRKWLVGANFGSDLAIVETTYEHLSEKIKRPRDWAAILNKSTQSPDVGTNVKERK